MKPLTIRIKRRKIMKSVGKPPIDETHYWFTINGGNGEIMAMSETYTKKHNAVKAINVLINGMGMAQIKDETK